MLFEPKPPPLEPKPPVPALLALLLFDPKIPPALLLLFPPKGEVLLVLADAPKGDPVFALELPNPPKPEVDLDPNIISDDYRLLNIGNGQSPDSRD